MRSRTFTLIAAAALPLLAGCSSFSRQWKASLKEPYPASDITGAWEGHWISEASGHTDRLRCVISPGPTNAYDAHFHAKYRKIFSFSYTVPLQVQSAGTNFTFSGEADLGKLAGGVYTYKGASTPTQFESTYNSKYDHGRFELARPEKR